MSNSYKLLDSIGLINCGNTCFLNSAIQMLFSINELREYIINPKIDIDFIKEIYLNQLCNSIYTEYSLNDVFDLNINNELENIKINIKNIIDNNEYFFRKLIINREINNFYYHKKNIDNIEHYIKIIFIKQFNKNIKYKNNYENKDSKKVNYSKLILNINKHINEFKNKILLQFKICKKLKKIFKMIFDKKYNKEFRVNVEGLLKLFNMNDKKQHDSPEIMDNILQNIIEYTKINKFFYNKFINDSYCQTKDKFIYSLYNNVNISTLIHIELENDSIRNLQYLINKYSLSEPGKKLETPLNRCGNDDSFKKESYDTSSSKYIIIQLKRMSIDTYGRSFLVNIPVQINNNIIFNNIKYNLLGVTLKNGKYSGHYVYATIDKEKESFKIYDDSSVTEHKYTINNPIINFNYYSYGKFELVSNAYLLLYYRDNYSKNQNSNIKNIINSDNINNIDNIDNIDIKLINNKNRSKNSICNILKSKSR